MDKTPNTRSSKLSCRLFTKSKESNETSIVLPQLGASTPVVQRFPESDVDDSPGYYPCTQEEFENLDVVWDWNSPQAKQKKKQKRLILNNSPKLLLRRHPSNNNIKNFEKLKEELQALRNEISVPDNEDCLVLSPLEETKFKSEPHNSLNGSAIESLIQENNIICDSELEDLFNDSADEDLFLVSQQIENNLESKHAEKNMHTLNSIYVNTNNVKQNLIPDCKQNPKILEVEHKIADDSFDVAVEQMDDEDLNVLTQVFNETVVQENKSNKKTNNNLQRHRSEVQYNTFHANTGKVEFYRTQSFELSNIGNNQSILPRTTLEEINRKRKEALAKLEAKRRHDSNESLYSPMKCSPEEIEQKRLQALAKLEAKRQQEIIEKKRQEALKKLEMNRKKNAFNVKSSLSKRL